MSIENAILSALTSYRMPSLLARIALDRCTPYEHRETHDLLKIDGETHDLVKTKDANRRTALHRIRWRSQHQRAGDRLQRLAVNRRSVHALGRQQRETGIAVWSRHKSIGFREVVLWHRHTTCRSIEGRKVTGPRNLERLDASHFRQPAKKLQDDADSINGRYRVRTCDPQRVMLVR